MPEGFLKTLAKDPAAKALMDQAKSYATKKAGATTAKLGTKLSGPIGDKAAEVVPGGEATVGAVQGGSEAKEGGKGKLGQVWGSLKGGVKGLFKKGKGGKANKRPTTIVENLMVGVPVEVAYDKWTAYQDWPGYMKGPESVDVDKAKDDGDPDAKNDDDAKDKVNFKTKVWWSKRSFTNTVEEDIQDERIKWTSEGPKGSLSGVVTFTPLGENLTAILVVIEYRSKGAVEWTANRWRAAGRRVRLDLKHFRRYVMMLAEEEQQQIEDARDEAENEASEAPETSETETPENGDETGQEDEAAPEQDDEEPSEEKVDA